VTRSYLVGELSVRLEQLQAVAASSCAADVASLRQQVESGPLAMLGPAAAKAIALADGLCWDSLTRGDLRAFGRQAAVSAELRLFGVSARLFTDDWLLPGSRRS
jgi:hypothetical protein